MRRRCIFTALVLIGLGVEDVAPFSAIIPIRSKPSTTNARSRYAGTSRVSQPRFLVHCVTSRRWNDGVILLDRGPLLATSRRSGGDGATDDDDEDSDEDETMDESMRKAFQSLDSITSLDVDDAAEVVPDDSLFAKKMEELERKADELNDENRDADGGSPEEVRLYTEMYQELSSGEDEMYKGVLGELKVDGGGKGDAAQNPPPKPMNDADGVGGTLDRGDTKIDLELDGGIDKEEFLDRAISEAMKDARSSVPDDLVDADPESIRNDKEMMRKINDLFDDATKQLVESVEEMRKEQTELSKLNEEARAASIKEDEERLAAAEGSVSSLISNVNKEAGEVERAVKDLQDAKSRMKKDPLLQILDFRNIGIVKQSSFVGFLLFTIRSLAELALVGGANGEAHASLAAGQAAIAFVCAVIFFLL